MMGGTTVHPTGVTLASGDPPSSLNAPGWSPGCHHLREVALEIALLEDHEQYLELAGAVSAGGRSEQGSGTQSGPLPHIGSIEEAVCPVVGEVTESRDLHLRNPGTGGRQEGMGVAEWYPAEAVERQPAEVAERQPARVAGQQPSRVAKREEADERQLPWRWARLRVRRLGWRRQRSDHGRP